MLLIFLPSCSGRSQYLREIRQIIGQFGAQSSTATTTGGIEAQLDSDTLGECVKGFDYKYLTLNMFLLTKNDQKWVVHSRMLLAFLFLLRELNHTMMLGLFRLLKVKMVSV